MNDHDNPTNTDGQGGIDRETELRNQENEAGQQGDAQFTGQEQDAQGGQQADYGGEKTDTLTAEQGQDQQTLADQAESGQGEPTQQTDQGGTGFVGSGDDQSSDYLTKGENQDFAPEGQGASDTDAGTSDITTGQPTSSDSTLDDGADTGR